MTFLTLMLLSQVQVQVQVPLPTVTFSVPPPLVVVQPGIQVVVDNDEEVFFTDGYYWVRRDNRWFHTRDHRGTWVLVEERGVPSGLGRLPPGQYRRFKGAVKQEIREEKREHHDEKKHGKGKKK